MITKKKTTIKKLNHIYFVVDEGDNIYNVFSKYDFDEDGYYHTHNGEDGYHISDFEIVFESDDFDDAYEWVQQKSLSTTPTPKTCCICGKAFYGWGNNPWPVKKVGICCNHCNTNIVLPYRLALLEK